GNVDHLITLHKYLSHDDAYLYLCSRGYGDWPAPAAEGPASFRATGSGALPAQEMFFPPAGIRQSRYRASHRLRNPAQPDQQSAADCQLTGPRCYLLYRRRTHSVSEVKQGPIHDAADIPAPARPSHCTDPPAKQVHWGPALSADRKRPHKSNWPLRQSDSDQSRSENVARVLIQYQSVPGRLVEFYRHRYAASGTARRSVSAPDYFYPYADYLAGIKRTSENSISKVLFLEDQASK